MRRLWSGVVGACATLSALPLADADDRKFTYSYEAKTLPKGSWELEQWATLQEGKDAGRWTTLLLRSEIEYGVTDRLNGSIYLNSTYQANHDVPGEGDAHDFGFESMSTEWKYKLTEPSVDAVGSLLYGELKFSNDQYEIETKIVLSKEVGPFTFAYNFIWEAVLARTADPTASPQWTWEHELSNTFGASYSLSIPFAVGVEAYDVSRFDRSLGGPHTHAYYAGPNVHYSGGSWWATLTLLQQVGFGHGLEFTDGDNTKFSIRLIVGVNF
ncbi:MAG TPA: DUF6662 family protein [Planctomycetota bacterium]|nr:DUF6662 family protein [Planctomycetota bacterium]